MNDFKLNSPTHWVLFFLFFFSVAIFLIFPKLDLAITRQFYSSISGFVLADTFIVRYTYLIFAKIHYVFLLILFFLLLAPASILQKTIHLKKRQLSYLLIILLVGPGLLVNIFLKDHSIGRARPIQIEEFGGSKSYSQPFEYSGQCHKNCSFVSGHASIGFYIVAFAWALRRRRNTWLACGIILGALVGFGRILQGGHFFSDVLFSFWAVFLTNSLTAFIFRTSYCKSKI